MRNDTVSAIRKIETNRDDLFAYEIAGHITSAEVENIYGLLTGAYSQHETIDLLIRLVDYEGVDWPTLFSQTTQDLRKDALKHLKNYAVINGPLWLETSIALVKPFLDVKIRAFNADDESEAWAWLNAKPV
ncbi:STAS/SEC14 domain-containing protein [Paenochrobactrum glaciei]|uniref:STAS/SEC14 domain-containing protein n=1 Tax=Paenochrobactrum glaciei TaxID=486407 RepID=A0ABP3R152_9HYPH